MQDFCFHWGGTQKISCITSFQTISLAIRDFGSNTLTSPQQHQDIKLSQTNFLLYFTMIDYEYLLPAMCNKAPSTGAERGVTDTIYSNFLVMMKNSNLFYGASIMDFCWHNMSQCVTILKSWLRSRMSPNLTVSESQTHKCQGENDIHQKQAWGNFSPHFSSPDRKNSPIQSVCAFSETSPHDGRVVSHIDLTV